MTNAFAAYTTDDIREYLLLSRKQILGHLAIASITIDRSKPDWLVSYTLPDGTIKSFTVKQGKDMALRAGDLLSQAVAA